MNRYLSDVATISQESLDGRADRQGDGRLKFEEFVADGAARNQAVMCGAEARFAIKYRGPNRFETCMSRWLFTTPMEKACFI